MAHANVAASQGPSGLVDGFGRRFEYLRLSVEDACNFRCVYCLPEGWKPSEKEPLLSVGEIRRLVAAFAGLGAWKVRLTGGEPTLRRDLVEVAAAVACVPGVRRVALSTNGFRLRELAPALAAAGVAAVNVSVDTLDEDRFERLTGRRLLREILAGVETCLELGLSVKLNAVLLRGENDGELETFLDYARARPVEVRFIELMRDAASAPIFEQRHLSAEGLLARLLSMGWLERPRSPADGPARRFLHPDFAGGVGVIAPYAKDFCATCNRLRVTSRGRLRLCLFAESEAPLRPWLSRDDQRAGLQAELLRLLSAKGASHYLPLGIWGAARDFAQMGG